MSKHKTSFITASLLAATLFAAGPVMAGDHSGKRGGHHNISKMCEQMEEGKSRFNSDKRQEKMAEHHEAMAERLQLNDEQREIWNDIRDEKREKHQKRMEKWQEKMKKRCAQTQK